MADVKAERFMTEEYSLVGERFDSFIAIITLILGLDKRRW